MATGTSVNMETEFWVVERREKAKKASNRSYPPERGEGKGGALGEGEYKELFAFFHS